MRTTWKRVGRGAKLTASCLTILLTVLGITTIAVYIGPGVAERRALRTIEAEFGPRQAFLDRFPGREDDPRTRRLVELDEELGILTGGTAAFRQVKGPLTDYIAQHRRSTYDPAPAPVELARYMRAHDAPLRALAALVSDGTPPQHGYPAPEVTELYSPKHALDHIQRVKLLTARALNGLAMGQLELASDSLQTAWILNESYRESPFLMEQLVASAGTRFVLQGLRHHPKPDDEWLMRLSDIDVRHPLILARVEEDRTALTLAEHDLRGWEPVCRGLSAKNCDELWPPESSWRSWLGQGRANRAMLRVRRAVGFKERSSTLAQVQRLTRCEDPRPSARQGLSRAHDARAQDGFLEVDRVQWERVLERCRMVEIEIGLTLRILAERTPGGESSGPCPELWERVEHSDGAVSIGFTGREPDPAVLPQRALTTALLRREL